MEAYSILAKYYDSLMKDFNYDAYTDFIKGYVKGEGIDLCCGTGEMTIRLAKLKCKMIGMDLSQEMLNEARNKARKNFQNIIFIQENLKDFEAPHKMDFITCVCDGFNYVDNNSLIESINNISKYLKSGAYLIFDFSSEYKLKNVLGNNTFCEDRDDVTYIWANELKEDRVEMQVSFFEPKSEDLYQRIDDNQTQYIHSLDIVKEALNKNFEYSVFDGEKFTDAKDDSLRYLIIAKRK